MKIQLFQNLFELEIAIDIRQVHKRFIKLPITQIILARRAIKFLIQMLSISRRFSPF